MKTYYECHFTFYPDQKDKVEPLAASMGFHTSIIYKDLEMGDEKYLYATKRGDELTVLWNDMFVMSEIFERNAVPFLRIKMEVAIFDRIYGENKRP